MRAHRGTQLHTLGWPQEAALRMLQNNLDPEVAEHPDELVVYGGTGKAARDWASFDALVRTLETLKGDETMLVQSGRPVGVMQTHEWAPRVLIANSNLVGDWANWDEFRRLEKLGLTMYGQMTAGSWIYIGTQGILQGTYETFSAIAAMTFDGTLAGTITLTAGLGGMGGAQPLAVTMNDGVAICVDVDPSRIARRIEHGYLDVEASSLEDALSRAYAARDSKTPLSIGLLGNAAAVFPQLLAMGAEIDIVTDQTSAHDPLAYLPLEYSMEEWDAARKADPTGFADAARHSMAKHVEAMVGFQKAGRRSSTTATTSAPRRSRPATRTRSRSPASCPPTSARCSPRARGRSAGRRLAATRRTSPPPTAPCSTCFPRTSRCARWIKMAGERVHFQGLPARICWLGYGERDVAGLRFNDMVASGEVSAPLVIGRDHLDSGSVASPYRETEAMKDGSDAIADWPLLNALVNTASGASWVSIHHGGGVGIGRSIHAGQVTVADGTPLAGEKIARVLRNDPGMGVIRHVDAGYDEAIEVADRLDVRVPMREG